MAFYRASIGGGGGSGGAYSNKFYNDGSAMSGSASLTNLTAGKNYLVLVYGAGTTNLVNTYYDGCTCTNGTLTKLRNMVTIGARHMAGTVYNFKPTGTSSTITLPHNGWVEVWEN